MGGGGGGHAPRSLRTLETRQLANRMLALREKHNLQN